MQATRKARFKSASAPIFSALALPSGWALEGCMRGLAERIKFLALVIGLTPWQASSTFQSAMRPCCA